MNNIYVCQFLLIETTHATWHTARICLSNSCSNKSRYQKTKTNRAATKQCY